MLLGLILGNLIDLDHVYYRLIGKVGWFSSACQQFGMQCSFNFYPLHNFFIFIIALAFSILLLISGIILLTKQKSKFFKSKIVIFIGWLGLGVMIHFLLDYIHLVAGFWI